MRIGIFGGSFDPPHLGHVRAAQTAVSVLKLDKLLIIPSGISPNKTADGLIASPDMRFRMAELAFSECPNAEVIRIEAEKSEVSYTADTLRTLKAEYPDAEFSLILGSDKASSFSQWRDADFIAQNAQIVFISRDGSEPPDLTLTSGKSAFDYQYCVMEPVCCSSTELREVLPNRGGVEFLPPAVYAYIVRKGLYDVKADFDWLRSQAYEMLKPSRVLHVKGCESEAVRLAERWGVDPDSAREAGILHDITKRCSGEEQIRLCQLYGITSIVSDLNETKILHAFTGAETARKRFNVSDAVFNAIRWHTTGKPNMSSLEKIIYLADYIEPNRSFQGLRELRKLAYTDLDQAMIFGLCMSISELKGQGIEPNELSRSALDYLISAG